jgi:beta-glucanase (GH16 family)
MANLKLALGLIPSTSKIEQAEIDLVKEYEKLQSFSDSEELKKYNELDAIVNSAEFKSKKKEIEGLTFKASEECHKESEYKKLQKAKDIKLYFKTLSGTRLKKFEEMDGSDMIGKYENLKKTVESAEFRQKQKSKEFKGSDDQQVLKEFNNLKSNADIKDYYKFEDSKELSNYRQVKGSQKLSRLEELKEYLSSDEFKTRKDYLLDKKRFEKSDMFVQEQEYEKLKKSDNIVWYLKVKDSDKFDILKKRELTFSDEFEGESLDKNKWLTNHYWADKLFKDHYSQETDLHCYTDKDNTEVRSSLLQICTRPQKANGKVWNPLLGGFRLKEFSYTSGLINTSKSFRQQFGTFKAKIKLNTAAGPNHAFRLLGDKITPHLDICRTAKGKVWADIFTSEKDSRKTSIGSKYSKDFFIYSLEWTPNRMVWKINDVVFYTQTGNLPDEPLYLVFTGGLEKAISGSSSMEVDWVRVYKGVD